MSVIDQTCLFDLLEPRHPDWRELVDMHPAAGPFHHPGWSEVLATTYGFDLRALVVRDDEGGVAMGLPVAILGDRWVSVPFADHCPPLVVDPRSIAWFEELRQRGGASSFEVYDDVPGGTRSHAGYRHVVTLDPDVDALRRRLHRSKSGALKKALAEGIVVERSASREALLDTFFPLHVQTRRRLGVPVQQKRFFAAMWECMIARGKGYVITACADSRVVAAAVFLVHNGNVVYKFSASDRVRSSAGTTAVLWHAIEQEAAAGAHHVDLGRTDTDNDGLRFFKQGWGSAEHELHYTTFGAKEARSRRRRAPAIVAPIIRHSPSWVARALGALAYRRAV